MKFPSFISWQLRINGVNCENETDSAIKLDSFICNIAQYLRNQDDIGLKINMCAASMAWKYACIQQRYSMYAASMVNRI